MTQQERDWLVALKKAKKKLIAQRQAAEEMGVTERHVRRLLQRMRQEGDRVVIHKLRGRPSNRRISSEIREQIVEILSDDVYRDFGPTLASEYLRKRHGIEIGREALRRLMREAGLWHAKRRKLQRVHLWRERKARFGELVQWDTSDHDWLEGRGEKLYLIHLIDDATSRLLARFVRHDSTEENMQLLGRWLKRHGRPLSVYTDRDSMFHNAPKRVDGADVRDMPPTQIGRALQELQIGASKANSPEAKGRVERSFQTAQDRLVKGLRVAGARTCEQANEYLEREFVPWWEQNCTVLPAHPDDAHRPLGREHDLAAILSFVKHPMVCNDYTFRCDGKLYRIDRRDVVPGLRGARIRLEQRLDGSLAARHGGKYLRFEICTTRMKPVRADPPPQPNSQKPSQPARQWMKGFHLKQSPSLGELYRTGTLDRI